jgi:hypothetical protein
MDHVLAFGADYRQWTLSFPRPCDACWRASSGGGARSVDDAVTLREIAERDASRDVAPMVPAPDAVLVDSSTQTLEEVVDSLASTVDARRRSARGAP